MGKFGEFTLFEHLAKMSGKLKDQPKGYCTNLGGFSLENYSPNSPPPHSDAIADFHVTVMQI